jgi:pimeloyl-ACP methyl ester carboxylesterase
MYPLTLSRLLALGSFSLGIASVAFGQMQVFATHEGKFLPVVAYNDDSLVILDGTSRERTYNLNIVVRAADGFTSGFVTLSDVHAELDVLQHASAKERADPSSVRARYRATITADRKLSDCYGLLTFVTQGSVGTRLVPIGRLSEGRSKNIELSITSELNSIGSLHIFSNGEEVRTSQHPDAYSLMKYQADLVKDVKGLPAVELVTLEDKYPHVLTLDGRRLATIRKRPPNKVLMVFDLESKKKLSETAVAGDDDYVGSLTWVSNDQLVYIAANRDVNYDHALYLLDANKGTTRKVLDHIFAVIESLRDHPEILELHSIKNGSAFMKYNALTGETFEFEEPSQGEYFFDAQGKPRIQFHYDGAKKFYEFRPTPTSRWRDLDDLVKQPGLKFNAKAAGELDRVAEPLSVGPDGDTLYLSSRLDSDTFQLAAFSMSQGIIKQTIAKHPKYDLTISDGGLTRLLFERKSSRLLGMIFRAQKVRVLWIDPGYAATQKNIDTMFPDHVNLPIDWSEDGTTFIYFSYSDQDPGTYYLLRANTGELMPLLQLSEHLKGKALGHTTPIEFKARDGAMIPAYVTAPPETGGKLPPLIVSIHGGPMDRDVWAFNPMNQFFATRGYVVLQVNYRGSSGYGAAFQTAGLRARLDTVVLDDIADGVHDLISKHLVDPNRIVVMGASFGGWATYMCLAKYPDLFRAGVAIAAVASWKKMQQADKWVFGKEYRYAYWKALLEHQDYEANAKYIEPLLRVAEIKQPVFIIHGERDQVVDPTEAKFMLDALKKQGTPVEAKSFMDSGHTDWPIGDRVEMLNEIAAFLERNLPADTAEATPARPPTDTSIAPATGSSN